jgi:hypothetical protein
LGVRAWKLNPTKLPPRECKQLSHQPHIRFLAPSSSIVCAYVFTTRRLRFHRLDPRCLAFSLIVNTIHTVTQYCFPDRSPNIALHPPYRPLCLIVLIPSMPDCYPLISLPTLDRYPVTNSSPISFFVAAVREPLAHLFPICFSLAGEVPQFVSNSPSSGERDCWLFPICLSLAVEENLLYALSVQCPRCRLVVLNLDTLFHSLVRALVVLSIRHISRLSSHPCHGGV